MTTTTCPEIPFTVGCEYFVAVEDDDDRTGTVKVTEIVRHSLPGGRTATLVAISCDEAGWDERGEWIHADGKGGWELGGYPVIEVRAL